MASPPYNHSSAISPPYPANSPLPQPPKRRQSDMPSSAPSIKRRKASMLSTTSASSAHPLRQTSFPPEQASRSPAFSRSPSADTMVSGSAAGGAGKTKKKKSKKSKGAANDDSSMVDGKSTASGPSGKKKRRASNASLDDEDEGASGGQTMAVELATSTKEEKAREQEHRALLTRSLDEDQFRRYEAWRASRFPDAVIRRIVNQTLSQSALPNVIIAVKSISKVFAGELIEGARRTQDQWLASTRENQSNGLPSPPREDGQEKELEKRRGPLTPDHLREALRRFRLTRDGGLAGQLGLFQIQHQAGTERFGVRAKGKRLLK